MARRNSLTISVVVTTHEQPTFLRKVLTGYLDQTRAPNELIVADDGSGPETALVVKRFKARAPFRVTHAWQQHTGMVRLSHLRNLATRASTGEYVIYTDGDCVPTRHFVADHERLARPGWLTQGKRMWVTRKVLDRFTGRENRARMLAMCLRGGLCKPHWLAHIPGIALPKRGIERILGCNMAVFRRDIVRVNGHNEDFVGFWRQDSEFVLRLMRSGVKRQDALFSAMVYHLEHEKRLVPEDLRRNSALLETARSAPVVTPRGLYPVGNSHESRLAPRRAAA